MKLVCPRVIRGNRGDLLSRWGILSTLAALGVDNAAVFCARARHVPPGPFRPYAYGPVYNLLPPPAGWRALARADTLLWTGGLDLQDDSSLAKLGHMLVLFSIYRGLGLRVVALMQGAGPLTTAPGRALARAILDRVDCFVARDPGSLALLASLGSRTPLVPSHDGIFLDGFDGQAVPAAEAAAIAALGARPAGRPLVAVNLRLWFHFTSGLVPYQFARQTYRQRAQPRMAAFVEAMAALVRALREQTDARVVLVSMYEPGVEPWEDDLPLLRRLKQRFVADDAVVVAEHDFTIPGLYALMARFDLVIGTRLHATLAALRAGVPAIHVAYTLKGRDIFAALGLDAYAVDIEQVIARPAAAADLAARALADAALRERVAAITAQAVTTNRRLLGDLVAASFRAPHAAPSGPVAAGTPPVGSKA